MNLIDAAKQASDAGIKDFFMLLPEWQRDMVLGLGGAYLGLVTRRGPTVMRGVAALVGIGGGIGLAYAGTELRNPDIARYGADLLIGYATGLFGSLVVDQARR